MTPEKAMLPTDLPPVALVALGVTLAIIFAINRFGWMQGAKAVPAAAAQAQVAAVIVDPTALNRASTSVEALTVSIKEATAAMQKQARTVQDLSENVERLKDEIIRSSAKMR